MKINFLYKMTCMVLLTAAMLIFNGCTDDTDDEIVDPALVGSWSNDLEGNNKRTFSIEKNGSFSATLNPAGGEGEGIVTGVLVKEDNEYKMNNMKETTEKDWGGAVSLYNGTYVQIELSNNNNTFELLCADNVQVEMFFGGKYFRQ